MYLGVDIAGTTTKMGLDEVSGTFISEKYFDTTSYSSANQFLSALKGIGVCAPSVNFYTGFIENVTNLGWSPGAST